MVMRVQQAVIGMGQPNGRRLQAGDRKLDVGGQSPVSQDDVKQPVQQPQVVWICWQLGRLCARVDASGNRGRREGHCGRFGAPVGRLVRQFRARRHDDGAVHRRQDTGIFQASTGRGDLAPNLLRKGRAGHFHEHGAQAAVLGQALGCGPQGLGDHLGLERVVVCSDLHVPDQRRHEGGQLPELKLGHRFNVVFAIRDEYVRGDLAFIHHLRAPQVRRRAS